MNHSRMIVVAGVSGSGKSCVGKALLSELARADKGACAFVEGDDFHSLAAKGTYVKQRVSHLKGVI